MRYSRDYELGISCQNCHGDGNMHAEYHVGHPGETKGKYILNQSSAVFERAKTRQLRVMPLRHA